MARPSHRASSTTKKLPASHAGVDIHALAAGPLLSDDQRKACGLPVEPHTREWAKESEEP